MSSIVSIKSIQARVWVQDIKIQYRVLYLGFTSICCTFKSFPMFQALKCAIDLSSNWNLFMLLSSTSKNLCCKIHFVYIFLYIVHFFLINAQNFLIPNFLFSNNFFSIMTFMLLARSAKFEALITDNVKTSQNLTLSIYNI